MNAQGTAPAVLHTSIPFIYDTKVNPKMTITVSCQYLSQLIVAILHDDPQFITIAL